MNLFCRLPIQYAVPGFEEAKKLTAKTWLDLSVNQYPYTISDVETYIENIQRKTGAKVISNKTYNHIYGNHHWEWCKRLRIWRRILTYRFMLFVGIIRSCMNTAKRTHHNETKMFLVLVQKLWNKGYLNVLHLMIAYIFLFNKSNF